MDVEKEKRRRIRSSSVGQKSTADDPSGMVTSTSEVPVFPAQLRAHLKHDVAARKSAFLDRPKTTYDLSTHANSELLESVDEEKPKFRIKKFMKKGNGDDLIDEQKKKSMPSLSPPPQGDSEAVMRRNRSDSFEKPESENLKGKEESKGHHHHHHHRHRKSHSKKEVSKESKEISQPTDFRHFEIKAALSTSHVIPHRFTGYTFTSIKSPKCSFCGSGFKGLRHKAYKCSECQYLCHPSCLPNVPADCGLRPELINTRRTSAVVQNQHSKGATKVFGVELARQLELEGTTVPKIVEACIAAVEKRGLEIQGLYRISGSNAQIHKLRDAFMNGDPNLDDSEWGDIAVVTSVLKQYLRELPASLLIPEIYCRLMDLIKNEHEAARIAGIKEAVRSLPAINRATLAPVVKHLAMVDKASSVNKMTSYNLSLLFGPTLMRGSTPMQDLEEMHEQARVIEHLIVHYDQIF